MKKEKSAIEEFFIFVRRPQYNIEESKKSWIQKFFIISQIFAFHFFVSFFVSYIIVLALEKIGYGGQNAIDIAIQSPWFFVIFACVYVPIAEEVAFRGWLKGRRILLSAGGSLLLYTLSNFSIDLLLRMGTSWVETYNIWMQEQMWYLALSLELLKVIVLFFLLFLLFSKGRAEKTNSFIKKHFGKFFYLATLTFASIHISNYTNITSIAWIFPLIVLPQFVGGLSLGYIRVRFGLIYSIVAHSINNLIPFLLIFGSEATAGICATLLILTILGMNIYNLVDFAIKK